MTLEEKIISTAFTGYSFCEGEEYIHFRVYADSLIGYPSSDIDMINQIWWNKLHELAKPDFDKMLDGEYTDRAKMKPYHENDSKYHCSACGNWIAKYQKFCDNCGQAQDWVEVKE